jgi:hypothetical protein
MKTGSLLLCGLALCLTTSTLLAQPAKAPAASADSPQTTQLGIGTSIRSGAIKTQVPITSAVVTRINGAAPTYKDDKNTDQTLKVGDTLENLKIDSATVVAAVAAGGTVKWPKSVTIDLARKVVKADEVADTTLQATVLTDVKIAGGQQDWKINGKKISGTISSNATLELSNVNIGKVTIADAELSPSALGDAGVSTSTARRVEINPKGDYFQIRTPVFGFAPASDDAVVGALIARRDTCFRVTHELDKKDPADRNRTIKFVRGTFEISGELLPPKYFLPPYGCKETAPAAAAAQPSEVRPHVSYDILRETLIDKADYDRYGWTYGVLAAPFKYYWNAGHEFSAGASIGPYFGYQKGDAGGSAAFVASVGATSASVKNPDGSFTQKNGLTFALAWLFEIKNDFNFGIINGWDMFGKTDGVPNSGRPWLSVSFGRKLD